MSWSQKEKKYFNAYDLNTKVFVKAKNDLVDIQEKRYVTKQLAIFVFIATRTVSIQFRLRKLAEIIDDCDFPATLRHKGLYQ